MSIGNIIAAGIRSGMNGICDNGISILKSAGSTLSQTISDPQPVIKIFHAGINHAIRNNPSEFAASTALILGAGALSLYTANRACSTMKTELRDNVTKAAFSITSVALLTLAAYEVYGSGLGLNLIGIGAGTLGLYTAAKAYSTQTNVSDKAKIAAFLCITSTALLTLAAYEVYAKGSELNLIGQCCKIKDLAYNRNTDWWLPQPSVFDRRTISDDYSSLHCSSITGSIFWTLLISG